MHNDSITITQISGRFGRYNLTNGESLIESFLYCYDYQERVVGFFARSKNDILLVCSPDRASEKLFVFYSIIIELKASKVIKNIYFNNVVSMLVNANGQLISATKREENNFELSCCSINTVEREIEINEDYHLEENSFVC